MKVGVIGLGAMGAPMARNLQRAGYLSAVYNRSPERMAEFDADTKVVCAQTLKELPVHCQLILICVSADQDVEQVVAGLSDQLSPAHILVDTSTIAASTAQTLAKQLKQDNIAFLDAPVSGGVEGAVNAKLVMMVGGDEQAFHKVMPVLKCISHKQVYLGESGAGQACKAVNQVVAAGINQAVTEGLAFAQALGLDADQVIDVLGSGAASSWFLQHRGPTMTRQNYTPGFKVALHHKDLKICRAMAESLTPSETRLPMVEMTLIHYKRLMDQGYADSDISALFKLKRALFKADD